MKATRQQPKGNSPSVLYNTPFYVFSFNNPKYLYKLLPIYFDEPNVGAVKINLPQDNTLSGACIRGISAVSQLPIDLLKYSNNGIEYDIMNSVDMAKLVLNLYDGGDCIIQNYPISFLRAADTIFGYRQGKMLATKFRFQTADSFLKKTNPLPFGSPPQVLLLEFLFEVNE